MTIVIKGSYLLDGCCGRNLRRRPNPSPSTADSLVTDCCCSSLRLCYCPERETRRCWAIRRPCGSCTGDSATIHRVHFRSCRLTAMGRTDADLPHGLSSSVSWHCCHNRYWRRNRSRILPCWLIFFRHRCRFCRSSNGSEILDRSDLAGRLADSCYSFRSKGQYRAIPVLEPRSPPVGIREKTGHQIRHQ